MNRRERKQLIDKTFLKVDDLLGRALLTTDKFLIKHMPTKNKIYTGIGSRSTPKKIQQEMERLAYFLATRGYTLRSGRTKGADQAFERGHDRAWQEFVQNGKRSLLFKEIYLPWIGFEKQAGFSGFYEYTLPSYLNNAYKNLEREVERVHPNFSALNEQSLRFHIRNVQQLFGINLVSIISSDFVICWTPEGRVVGGTATVLRLAHIYNIPVYNLALQQDRVLLGDTLKEIDAQHQEVKIK